MHLMMLIVIMDSTDAWRYNVCLDSQMPAVVPVHLRCALPACFSLVWMAFLKVGDREQRPTRKSWSWLNNWRKFCSKRKSMRTSNAACVFSFSNLSYLISSWTNILLMCFFSPFPIWLTWAWKEERKKSTIHGGARVLLIVLYMYLVSDSSQSTVNMAQNNEV